MTSLPRRERARSHSSMLRARTHAGKHDERSGARSPCLLLMLRASTGYNGFESGFSIGLDGIVVRALIGVRITA